MKDQDVRIGMRVVPHSKSDYPLSESMEYKKAHRIGHKYLYVIKRREGESTWVLHSEKNDRTGDYFESYDFEPYDTTPTNAGHCQGCCNYKPKGAGEPPEPPPMSYPEFLDKTWDRKSLLVMAGISDVAKILGAKTAGRIYEYHRKEYRFVGAEMAKEFENRQKPIPICAELNGLGTWFAVKFVDEK